MQAQRPNVFPFQAKAPEAKKANHQDPGDFINGVRVPKAGQKQRERKEGDKKILLCGICGERDCPYTVEI